MMAPMRPRPFMREVVDAFMPKGAIWSPAYGGDFDRLLNGVAENQQAVLEDLGNLANVRNPSRCKAEMLPDLEREFGITPNTALAEKERRAFLATIRYKRQRLAAVPKLQRALNVAGFGTGGYGLAVTQNASPPTDPSIIVENAFSMTAHSFPSIYCAGNSVAYCGYGGGYYLVSGDVYDGGYVTPPEPYWPMVFFVGGDVTRDNSGKIVGVGVVPVPARRRQELHRLVLRIKPLGTWAAMMVCYV